MSLMASVLILGSAAVSHANADDDSRLIEVASRVEREWQGRNPEAKGLADRVRYLLKTPEPKADHELLSFVRLPSGRLDVMCGIDSACGFIFAHSDQGIDAEIQELEIRYPQPGIQWLSACAWRHWLPVRRAWCQKIEFGSFKPSQQA